MLRVARLERAVNTPVAVSFFTNKIIVRGTDEYRKLDNFERIIQVLRDFRVDFGTDTRNELIINILDNYQENSILFSKIKQALEPDATMRFFRW